MACFVDIKMDWSSPGEILAVGGHQRPNDSNYFNQILFYTRRGEFLHRVHIPQMVSFPNKTDESHANYTRKMYGI